ncbi:hypothetical protein HPP92_001094 [Vanilla planifolia]|uniref:Uncharacterized protein n=1 Tax=Vanilla planifolia TaxID=51239 RepID=A0A835VGM0_VANPL|nr:hypothetical protein HPP92_001094 [Vanilla planifolia]
MKTTSFYKTQNQPTGTRAPTLDHIAPHPTHPTRPAELDRTTPNKIHLQVTPDQVELSQTEVGRVRPSRTDPHSVKSLQTESDPATTAPLKPTLSQTASHQAKLHKLDWTEPVSTRVPRVEMGRRGWKASEWVAFLGAG